MKTIARNALQLLAQWICDGCSFAWPIADRIEKRWGLHGATEFMVRQSQANHAAFLKAEIKRHDAQFPDRLTYLHR